MEDLKTKAGELKEHVSDYAKTAIGIAKAKATKGASSAAAGAAIGVTAFLLAIFFLIFLFTGVAWWLASLLNSAALGFFLRGRLLPAADHSHFCVAQKSDCSPHS